MALIVAADPSGEADHAIALAVANFAYAAELESAQVSVSSLCIAPAVAPTTALRWIARMTEAGLLVRQPDPFDRRRAFLALSEPAWQNMDRYFAVLRQSGFDAL